MQGKRSKVNNFGSQECKQKQKIDSHHSDYTTKNKKVKKVMDLRDGSGWGDTSDRPGRSHDPSSIRLHDGMSFITYA